MECVVKGCGFFGSVETGNMCSKCYKDFINTKTLSNKPISAADEKRLPVYEKAHEIGEKLSELIEAVERNGGCELLDHCYALRIELSKITQRHFNFVEAVLRGEETLSSGNNVEVEMSEIAAGISKLMSLIDRIAHEKLASGMDGLDESWEKMEGSTIETKKKKNRCERCNKKVGLLGFRCRCGGIFCGLHRMPELHTCEVDYKEINGSNPNPHLALIKADKLEYRI